MSEKMMMSFDDVLAKIRAEQTDTHDLGTKFEVLIKKYFENDRLKSTEYTGGVWLWGDDDCPGRTETLKNLDHSKKQKKDHGIDLVAKKYDGTLCAIQCKCYDDDTHLYESNVSNFIALAASSVPGSGGKKKIFDSAIFVWTGKEITSGAGLLLENNNCEVLDRTVLKDSKVVWSSLLTEKPKRTKPYELQDHQKKAMDKVIAGFDEHDRGKMIMACGTGKTFTTLKIAERQVTASGARENSSGLVLYLVPSISLLAQSMREWAEQAAPDVRHRYLAVCSDTKVDRESEDASMSELEVRPTTDASLIAKALEAAQEKRDHKNMTVVFSTYQSLMQVSKAQKKCGMVFDLVICDEAHRTTGVVKAEAETNVVKIADKDGTISGFTAVHKEESIRARKRLYVTATPKIYTAASIQKAKQGYDVQTYSMDDETTYGPSFYSLTFGDALDQDLLSDYKVVIMKVNESEVAGITQRAAADADNTLQITKVAQWIGCWRGLVNPDKTEKRKHPLQRVIAFTQSIMNSKRFAHSFTNVIDQTKLNQHETSEVKHVDGSHDALNRKHKLDWLKESYKEAPNECRILSNARCLSEGVDVPALDAVVFLNPKESIIDVIQAVGRVMRKAEGKKYGYVVLPIAIPAGLEDPEQALDNDKTFRVVWNVLRALRAHDSKRWEQRMLDGDILSDIVIWDTPGTCPDCQAGICETHTPRPPCKDCESEFEGNGVCSKHSPTATSAINIPPHLIQSKLIEKISDRRYLESWAKDVEKIVTRTVLRINEIYQTNNTIQKEMDELHAGLKKIINDAITFDETVDMLAQHMVMGRVFDSLFRGFTEQNPISRIMERVRKSLLEKGGLAAEMQDLEEFYKEVDARVSSVKTHEGRQKVIHTLYDKFFNHAFKKTAEKLGIVFTPIEIVDFILQSTDHLMRENFGKGVTSKDVDIIDPFTGTGSFITRLMSKELNLIRDRDLEYKYRNNLYANEIILLAYYIAAVNCESTFFARYNQYVAFPGITLMDTFHAKNFDDEWNEGVFSTVQKQIEKQRNAKITLIVGNPPYSAGQKTANEDNKNTPHPELQNLIKESYIKNAPKGNTRGLYNTYIKALRWASNRIGDSGVIGFIIPSAYITGISESGIRVCLQQEFTDVYCFNLRGNAKLQGEERRKESGTVFGSGSREAVVITILVKNPSKNNCTIHYKDIGDYLNRDEKLQIINEFKSAEFVDWETIKPDKHNDWINQRGKSGDDFEKLMPMGSRSDKGKQPRTLFNMFSRGLVTGRDDWVYNSSYEELEHNMKTTIEYCKSQDPDNFQKDVQKISWSTEMSHELKKLTKPLKFNKSKIRVALFRPFIKQFLYFDPVFITAKYRIPTFFPSNETKNLNIIVPDKIKGGFSTFVTDTTPDLHIMETNQCFPLKQARDSLSLSLSLSRNNLCIIVPDKIKGEFSVFITNQTPDLEIVHHGQVFPFKVMT